MAWKRLLFVLVVGLASGLIAAGCGDDDEDGGDGNGASVPTDITLPTVTDAESGEEAQQQATEAVEDARSQAYEACIDALDQVPDEQREAAEEACESLK